jgi:hypothetical protein
MLGKNQKKKALRTKRGSIASSNGRSHDHCGSESPTSSPSIPNKVGSDLSFTQFADTIEPSLLADIIECKPALTIICITLSNALSSLVHVQESLIPLGKMHRL